VNILLEVKKLDNQGRIVLPREWRKKFGDEVIVVTLEDRIEIFPRKGNLLKFIDQIEVEELKEWNEMKKELLSEE
jgi:AbrB family looped-hinge helix DNA binding protein